MDLNVLEGLSLAWAMTDLQSADIGPVLPVLVGFFQCNSEKRVYRRLVVIGKGSVLFADELLGGVFGPGLQGNGDSVEGRRGGMGSAGGIYGSGALSSFLWEESSSGEDHTNTRASILDPLGVREGSNTSLGLKRLVLA